jgi:large subunit ribosomal protein L1
MTDNKKQETGDKKQVFDKSKKYPVEEAVKIARQLSKAKFDESVEIHANLGIDPKQGDQQVRGTIALPHGTGKSVKIAAFVQGAAEKDAKEAGADIIGNEELINEIKTKGKIEFDVAITTPDMMPKLAVLAKILGPKGLMPSPKNETITTKVKETIAALKKGKIVFKNDDTANIHVAIGKMSFDDVKIAENATAFITLLKKSKPASSKGTFIKNLVLKTSMGQAIKLEV